MKDKLFGFIAGILLTACIAATGVPQVFTFIPAMPRYTKLRQFDSTDDSIEFMKESIRDGYQIQSITKTSYSIIIIMVKY
jgi:hypothetical protein